MLQYALGDRMNVDGIFIGAASIEFHVGMQKFTGF